LLEVIRAIRVIRGKKLPVRKISCNAAQSFPKEKVKAGMNSHSENSPKAKTMKEH
jgi:hypothetical protein